MDRLLFVLYLTQIKDRLISAAEDISNKLDRLEEYKEIQKVYVGPYTEGFFAKPTSEGAANPDNYTEVATYPEVTRLLNELIEQLNRDIETANSGG
jgi:hypothetical protein